jgi:hypothetical protein
MSRRSEQIELALSALAGSVAAALAPSGWTSRELDDCGIAALTRQIGDGIIATAELGRASFRSPDDFPIAIGAQLGVGYEAALNLMPLLTLTPTVTLVNNPETSIEPGFLISLDDPDTVESVGRQIVAFVEEHAAAFAQQFPDAESVAAAMEPGVESGGVDSDDERGRDEDPLRLTMLAAIGRNDRVRAWLADQSAASADLADRRFIRQLTRWLDAGGPAAPPLEETLARLPHALIQPRPSWSDARATAMSRKEALNVVRAQSKGKTLDELRALLAAEYAQREVDVAPSAVARHAAMLSLERQPFGRIRSAWKATRTLATVGSDAIHIYRNSSEPEPEWMRLPDRASFPIPVARTQYTSVELQPQIEVWLDQAYVHAPRRFDLYAFVEVWLSRDGDSIAVHLGQRRIGAMRGGLVSVFDQVMSAAALFDEDPFVRGRLTAEKRMPLRCLRHRSRPGRPGPRADGLHLGERRDGEGVVRVALFGLVRVFSLMALCGICRHTVN